MEAAVAIGCNMRYICWIMNTVCGKILRTQVPSLMIHGRQLHVIPKATQMNWECARPIHTHKMLKLLRTPIVIAFLKQSIGIAFENKKKKRVSVCLFSGSWNRTERKNENVLCCFLREKLLRLLSGIHTMSAKNVVASGAITVNCNIVSRRGPRHKNESNRKCESKCTLKKCEQQFEYCPRSAPKYKLTSITSGCVSFICCYRYYDILFLVVMVSSKFHKNSGE